MGLLQLGERALRIEQGADAQRELCIALLALLRLLLKVLEQSLARLRAATFVARKVQRDQDYRSLLLQIFLRLCTFNCFVLQIAEF